MTRVSAVVTAVGPDRPGIVDRVAAVIHDAGCNIEESRMAVLGGEFALIQLFSGAKVGVDRVKKGMKRAARELGLTFTIKTTRAPRRTGGFLLYRLKVSGLDHPGIVHRIASVLAGMEVNIASMDTRQAEAPVSGTPVFSLAADLQVPMGLAVGELRKSLDAVCAAEALDFSLEIAG